jgi:hypothetical protein
MKPIYFPFTYVPHGVAQALAACFQRFIVYQPSGKKVPDEMQPWVDANRMEVRVPDQTDDQAIERVVKDFRSFASLHNDSGNLKTTAFLGQHSTTPFFSETSTSRIVSDLKEGVSTDSAERGSDPLFCARVFLGFAQDFDRQEAELNRGLGVHARQSRALLKTLKGETEIDSGVNPLGAESKVDDPGEYMALARLQSWALLFQNDPVGSGLFVTSSKSVFNQLTAKLPAFEKILQIGRNQMIPGLTFPLTAWVARMSGSRSIWCPVKYRGIFLPNTLKRGSSPKNNPIKKLNLKIPWWVWLNANNNISIIFLKTLIRT